MMKVRNRRGMMKVRNQPKLRRVMSAALVETSADSVPSSYCGREADSPEVCRLMSADFLYLFDGFPNYLINDSYYYSHFMFCKYDANMNS